MTMNCKSTVKPNLEQLDDRILPAAHVVSSGGTASGLTWTLTDTNKFTLIGTNNDDRISLFGAGTLYVVDGNSPGYYFNTGVALSPTLRIEVQGRGGNDYIYNGLNYWDYDKATLSGGEGNDLIRAGAGHDTLYGDGGDDCLVGSIGSYGYPATMIGGTGSDTFITKSN